MSKVRFVSLSFIIIAIFLLENLFASSDHAVENRVKNFNQAAGLLDEGKNNKAAEILKIHIKKYPSDLEAVSQFIKSYAKMCDVEEAERFLDNWVRKNPVDQSPLLTNFVSAEKKLYSRKFEKGIEYLDKVLLPLENGGDSLSFAICLLEKTRCCIGKRDADLALRLIDRITGVIDNIPDADRLLLESLVLKAQSLNMFDRLSEADSIYRFVQDRSYFKGYLGLQSFCLNGRARGLEKQQRIVEAEHLYRKAYNKALVVNYTEKTAGILNNLGQIETQLGKYSSAAEHLKEAKLLAEECGSRWLLGYIFYGLGSIAETSGKRVEALEYFRSSYDRHESAGNRWGKLGTRLRIGYNLAETGDYSESISSYKYCLKEYERTSSLYGQSWALGGLAMAFHKLGDLASAEKYYKRTYCVREKMGDKKGAAWSRNFLGMVCNLTGRHREALSYEFEAADIYMEIGDRRGEGMAYFSIGSVYFYLGNYKKAMKHYDKAFAIATETGDNDLLYRVLSGMGSVYSSVGRLDKVEDLYMKAVELTRGLNNRSATNWSLNNLASHYIETGRKKDARKYLEEASKMLRVGESNHIRAKTLYLMGKTEPDIDKAIDNITAALKLAEEIGLQEFMWNFASDLGNLYLTRRDTLAAKAMQEKAIHVVESLRRRVGSDELKRHMLEPAILPYERIVSLLLADRGNKSSNRKNIMKAFEYTERSRAQVFSETLRKAFATYGSSKNVSLGVRERELISKLTFLQNKLQEEPAGSENSNNYLRRIEEVESDFDQLRIKLSEVEEGYTEVVYPEVDDVSELTETLKEGEKALSYFLGTRQSWLFCVSRETVNAYPLPARGIIEEKVKFFLSLLKESGDVSSVDGVRMPKEVMTEARSELYGLLVKPAIKDILGANAVIIIPDGLLNYLPFQLLGDNDDLLISKHALFSVPSLKGLSYLRKREREKKSTGYKPQYSILSLGSSGAGLSVSKGRERKFPYTGVSISLLPHAEDEARSVAGIFNKAIVLTGNEASEYSFKNSRLDAVDILHVASHSYVDNSDVRRSFIVLNPAEKQQKGNGNTRENKLLEREEDGLFQWHEILELKLKASLVTLSACMSAGGVLSKGEGITGLSQAFLYAGADCVLASITDVPDCITVKIMDVFYRSLRSGCSANMALRKAQLEMKTGKGNESSPAFWAGFVLIGDGSVRLFPSADTEEEQ